MEQVVTTSRLDAPAEVVWAAVQRVALLQEIARPLLVMSVPAGTPARWPVGADEPKATTITVLGGPISLLIKDLRLG